MNRRAFFGSAVAGFVSGVIYKLQPRPRRPVDPPRWALEAIPNDGTVILRNVSWQPVLAQGPMGLIIALPESQVVTWEEQRERLIASSVPVTWDQVSWLASFEPGLAVLMNNRPWVGPRPSYWLSEDVWLCDWRDGDRVRALINRRELPLRRPRIILPVPVTWDVRISS